MSKTVSLDTRTWMSKLSGGWLGSGRIYELQHIREGENIAYWRDQFNNEWLENHEPSMHTPAGRFTWGGCKYGKDVSATTWYSQTSPQATALD